MSQYILRRLLLIIPTFLGVTLLVFTITRMVPGGPVERMLSESASSQNNSGASQEESGLSEEQIQELKAYYGLDRPIMEAYASWLKKLFKFDLGESLRFQEPVWPIIKSRLPVSIYYGLITMFVTYLVCIPLGIFKAIYHKSFGDNISSVVIFIAYAVPSYIVAIGLMYFFASKLEWFPLGGIYSDDFEDFTFLEQVFDILSHSFLPLTAYLAGSFAVMTFLMKNSMMDNLSADYIRTAMAKGMSFKQAVFKHAFRNSLIPMATTFGNNISLILTGSFLIETIFNIDGLGLLGYESIVNRDYPIVMGILVLSSLLFMIGNILSDFCVALVDPRIKFK